MTEERNVINIDGTNYLVDDISESCRTMLGNAQQTNSAISLLGALLQSARQGADLNMKEAMKLLPDPVADEASAESEPH